MNKETIYTYYVEINGKTIEVWRNWSQPTIWRISEYSFNGVKTHNALYNDPFKAMAQFPKLEFKAITH